MTDGSPSEAETELPSSPYKGLAPFDESELDGRFFFGRERETELVAANLMASRLTVLYGPSGVGKSSMLRAGVARRLRSFATVGGPQPGLDVVIVDAWRDDPVSAIAAAVGIDEPEGRSLADLLAERTLIVGGELYLVLDQMEEYFLYHRGGGPLAPELDEILARPDLRVHVLLGIRDDELASLDAFKSRMPGLFGNVVRLDHLDRDGARSAICGPLGAYAELGGNRVTAEPGLVDAVIDQVRAGRIEHSLAGRGGVAENGASERVEAPFLQLVMERLWQVERADGSSVLRLSTLSELGGAARIVERHLEVALASLLDADRDLASRLFHHLVTPSGTKIAYAADDLARYAEDEEGRLDPVLHELAAQRIVRPLPARNGGGPRYEIFHDVLADPVLAWRTAHETERALAQERAEGRRRHRRLALIAGLAIGALVLTTAVAVFALVQRERADDRARSAKARELTVESFATLGDDPELSLLLARSAATFDRTPSVSDALRAGIVQARELRSVTGGRPLLAAAVRGRSIVTVPEAGVTAAAFSRDGRQLARGIGRRVVVTAADGSVVAAHQLSAPVVRVALDGGLVAAAAADGMVHVWSLDGAERLRRRLPARPTVLALSRDGSELVAGSGKVARLIDLASGDTSLFESRSTVFAADVSADRTLLATGSADGGVRLWRLSNRRLVDVFRGHENSIRAVAFTPDGSRLLTGSADRTARVWRTDDGHPFATLAGHEDEVRSVWVSPDGREVVTASTDGTARVWDASGDPELREVTRVPGRPPVLERVDGGTAIVDSGQRRYAVLLSTGRVTPMGRPAPPSSRLGPWTVRIDGDVVQLSRPGKTLVLRGHRDDVTSVRLSPDGSRILTASADHDVRRWSAVDGTPLPVIKAHVGRVTDARYSPDGRWIVTAGPGAAGVWNADTGQRLFYLRGVEGKLVSAAFAPDGRTIVATGEDGTVRTYRCDVCGEIDELLVLADRTLARTGRRLTADERRQYLGD